MRLAFRIYEILFRTGFGPRIQGYDEYLVDKINLLIEYNSNFSAIIFIPLNNDLALLEIVKHNYTGDVIFNQQHYCNAILQPQFSF